MTPVKLSKLRAARKREKREIREALKKALSKRIRVDEGGRRKYRRRIEVILEQLGRHAAMRNLRAFKAVVALEKMKPRRKDRQESIIVYGGLTDGEPWDKN